MIGVHRLIALVVTVLAITCDAAIATASGPRRPTVLEPPAGPLTVLLILWGFGTLIALVTLAIFRDPPEVMPRARIVKHGELGSCASACTDAIEAADAARRDEHVRPPVVAQRG